jgi:hypothetical protein
VIIEVSKEIDMIRLSTKLVVALIRKAASVEEIQQWFDRYAITNPTDTKYDHTSLYIMFSDGEVCITKAGYLWGQRGMHMLSMAKEKAPPEGLRWPSAYNNHKCIIVDNHDVCEAMHDLLFDPPETESEEGKHRQHMKDFFDKVQKPNE